MIPKITKKKLIEEFKDRDYFTRKELFDFYLNSEPELNENTFGWRIYDLKNKNIIKSVKRGFYVISRKPEYKPVISPDILNISKRISRWSDEVNYCIWETTWLNEFMQHQANQSALLVEIEKDFEEALFFELKTLMRREVFLNPDEKVIDLYIAESNKPVIIRKLLTRTPLTERTEKRVSFYTPTLEKILVDLYTEKQFFYYLQGSELIHIYENAISAYTINFTRLFSYAKRREREQDIKNFMTNHMYHLVKDIIDD